MKPPGAMNAGRFMLAMASRRLEPRRKRKNRQLPAERRVVGERRIAADRTKTFGPFGQTGRKTDACPAADAGEHRDILLAIVLIGHDVADNAGRRLEFEEFIARCGVNCFQIAFKRAVEDDIAGQTIFPFLASQAVKLPMLDSPFGGYMDKVAPTYGCPAV